VWEYLFGERAAARAARRKFWETVSDRISKLANESYWSLANYTGVLAAQLEEYLRYRTYLLLLQWDDHKVLKDRLEAIAEAYRDTSFCYFCRILKLFNDFQFENSNTYLLTSYWSGEMSRKLYNQFVEATEWEDSGQRVDTFKILRVMEGKVSPTDDRLIAKLPVDDFNRLIANVDDDVSSGTQGLASVRSAYARWLVMQPSKVRLVAESLRAYSELLHHELAILYEDWLKKRPGGRDELANVVASESWPNVVSVGAFYTIDRARFQGSSLRPIGRVQKQPTAQRAASGRGGGPKDRLASKSGEGVGKAIPRSRKRGPRA
jgi:hypothetical protein